jgi:hypothetical protein
LAGVGYYSNCIYFLLRATFVAKKLESQITGKEKKYGYDIDRYFNSHLRRRTAHLASQQKLGILSQRWTWIGSSDFDHPAADGADLK